MSSNIDLPAIRERAAAFEELQENYRRDVADGLTYSSEWRHLNNAARNTTLAADVRGLIEEVERLRMLVGEQ